MKTGFRIFLGLLLSGLVAWAETDSRPDLTGRVTQADGSPVAKATVFIYTAGPKKGTANMCPSCYPDCRKKAQTDTDGKFKIESLDSKLWFRLLVVASGLETKFVTKVDPAKGEQKIALKPLTAELLASKTHISGIVLGPDGKALAGATIGPEGMDKGGGTQWGGTDDFVDPEAVADERGRFTLLCSNSVTAIHALADGKNAAKRWVALKPGVDYVIRMQEGVTVSGRLHQDKTPVAQVMIGLATVDRVCGNFFHCDEVTTDKNGRFFLPNVPPEREFSLYAKMDSLKSNGALIPKIITTGKSGTTLDVGKLSVVSGHTVGGRVVLSDGKQIPEGTRLLLSREQAWDNAETVLDSEGRFEFKNVPPEAVDVSVRVKGYKFSKKNPNLDWLNGGIVGRVQGDIAGLILLMEPGQWRYNGEEGEAPEGKSQPRDEPLRSVRLETAANNR